MYSYTIRILHTKNRDKLSQFKKIKILKNFTPI